MKLRMKPLDPDDYQSLFEIAKTEDPLFEYNYPTIDSFGSQISQRVGWTILYDFVPIGCVTIGSICNGNGILHAFVKREYRGKWFTKGMLREVFDFIFNQLGLNRISGVSFFNKTKTVTLDGELFLDRLGFHQETNERALRNVFWWKGVWHHQRVFGMTRDECRWIGA